MNGILELVYASSISVYLPIVLGIASGVLLKRARASLDSSAFARILIEVYFPIVVGLRTFLALNDLSDSSWSGGWMALLPLPLSSAVCLFWRRLRKSMPQCDIEGYAMGSSNSGFLGLPLLDLIFGKDPECFLYYTVFQLGAAVYFLIFAPTAPARSANENLDAKERRDAFYVKYFLLIAIVLSGVARLLHLPAGPLVRDCCAHLTLFFSHAGLLAVGLIVFESYKSYRDGAAAVDWVVVYGSILCRFVLSAGAMATFVLTERWAFHWGAQKLRGVIFLSSALPIATSNAILARGLRKDNAFTMSTAVAVNTSVFLVLLSGVIWFIRHCC